MKRWLRKTTLRKDCAKQGFERKLLRKALVEEDNFEERLCEAGFHKEVVERSVG